MNAPEDRLGSKLGHGSDVRCKTSFLPQAQVHRRSCYVAKVPGSDICNAQNGGRYSITSSAVESSVGGTVKPSTLAAA
jgi:hypothetical protein